MPMNGVKKFSVHSGYFWWFLPGNDVPLDRPMRVYFSISLEMNFSFGNSLENAAGKSAAEGRIKSYIFCGGKNDD